MHSFFAGLARLFLLPRLLFDFSLLPNSLIELSCSMWPGGKERERPSMDTHYQVLNLTPSILSSQNDPSSLIKRAYRRALLQNHPDKAPGSFLPPSASSTTKNTTEVYTIDRIQEAYTVLSSPTQRANYDAQLRLGGRPSGDGTSSNDDSAASKFHTGVENVDLDDLEFDEQEACWFRSCRCGNDRAYLFRESDLDEVGDEGELMVGCLDCSLWLRVHFAVMEDDEQDS
ncbi:diphthamide biosynthesis protein 4 [Geosmithia morbida]|uniref:Diphthamide biosynthesis protein 4 n=1 Tax=Geosmithia morbida TaxID=1094350 RepID=A0A9P5D270_9HYPO|nr:diphthamide biosynthesis protein 4 [Geosmithia morbida]KAF4123542.1 diphthamide biosynthesis protein 4 [Geosmithia morbida]